MEDGARWRKENAGYYLFSASALFVRDKLRIVHANGHATVRETHMALFQNLDAAGTSLSRIAARAGLAKQSMSELVDWAEKTGLVEKRLDPLDARVRIVGLTPAGAAMLKELRKGVLAAERRMAAVTGTSFLAEMKKRLCVYARADPPLAPADDVTLSAANAAWRRRNIGRALFSARRRFVRDILDSAFRNGAPPVPEVQLALYRNLDIAGTRLTDIAARAQMTKQSMRELVDKAEIAGMVTRRPDPADGRAKLVLFTPAGLAMLDQLRHGIVEAEHRLTLATGADFVAELKTRLGDYIAAVTADGASDLPVSGTRPHTSSSRPAGHASPRQATI